MTDSFQAPAWVQREQIHHEGVWYSVELRDAALGSVSVISAECTFRRAGPAERLARGINSIVGVIAALQLWEV